MAPKLALLAGPDHLCPTTFPGVPGQGGTRQRAQRTIESTRRDAAVTGVGNQDASSRIDRHIVRIAEVGCAGRAVVAAKGTCAIARYGADYARRWINRSNALIPDIGDEIVPSAPTAGRRAIEKRLGCHLVVMYVCPTQHSGSNARRPIITARRPGPSSRPKSPCHRHRPKSHFRLS